MFAVIETGGKQYRVSPEDVIRVERLPQEAGAALELPEVLAMGDGDNVTLGKPRVDGARVAATVIDHVRADKIIVFRKNRRKNFRRKKGHRQHQTVLRIDEILAAGQERSKAAKPAAKKEEKPAAKTAKSAASTKKPAASAKTAAAKKPAKKSTAKTGAAKETKAKAAKPKADKPEADKPKADKEATAPNTPAATKAEDSGEEKA